MLKEKRSNARAAYFYEIIEREKNAQRYVLPRSIRRNCTYSPYVSRDAEIPNSLLQNYETLAVLVAQHLKADEKKLNMFSSKSLGKYMRIWGQTCCNVRKIFSTTDYTVNQQFAANIDFKSEKNIDS